MLKWMNAHSSHFRQHAAVPAPTSPLSWVILPDKLGPVESRNPLQRAMGVSARAPLPFPGGSPSLGRQAGRLGDVKESQRKRFFPERAIQLSHCRCKNTSEPPNRSEPSTSRQASDHASLPPAPPAARDAAPSADETSKRKRVPGFQPRAGRADAHATRLPAQSIPLAHAARAFVE